MQPHKIFHVIWTKANEVDRLYDRKTYEEDDDINL